MKKVVIIGGGFCGAYVAKKLEDKLDVTLIDSKDYYEFTPGVLRTIVEPKHAGNIELMHKDYLKKARVIVGRVQDIHKNKVILESKREIEYDYLVIATGSRYNSPFKESDIIISYRGRILSECYEKLCKAKKIMIVGGGIVGVELAAEIVKHYNGKELVIVHNKNRLMERQPEKASRYAERWLKKNGVKILFNENVVKFDNEEFLTDKGSMLKSDMAFLCTGIMPNYEMIKKCFPHALDEKNFVKVNSYLQMKENGNILVGGDIASIKEEKTAQNAEKHANIIIRNIKNMKAEKKLKEYISGPRIMVISLGKYNGILTYKNFVLTGLIPGLLKTFVEVKTMIRYRS